MSIKKIIVAALAGILSFSGMFAVSLLTAPETPPAAENNDVSSVQAAAAHDEFEKDSNQITAAAAEIESGAIKSITETRLKTLVYDVREKIREYETRLKELEAREKRLEIARKTLQNDLQKLDSLQIEMASTVAKLKAGKEELENSRIKIQQQEQENLAAIASAYDKMEPAQASDIIINMSKLKNSGSESAGIDDAVKILYFMGERPKAELLAEMVRKEPALAAFLCNKLKIVSPPSSQQ